MPVLFLTLGGGIIISHNNIRRRIVGNHLHIVFRSQRSNFCEIIDFHLFALARAGALFRARTESLTRVGSGTRTVFCFRACLGAGARGIRIGAGTVTITAAITAGLTIVAVVTAVVAIVSVVAAVVAAAVAAATAIATAASGQNNSAVKRYGRVFDGV